MFDLKFTYFFIRLLPICLYGLLACTGESDEVLSETGLPIRWSVQSEQIKDGRALIESSANLQTACSDGGQAIGIWSAYQRKDEELIQHVLGNEEGDVSLVYQGTSEGWTYGEAVYWKRSAVYYFNTYFPKENGMTNIAHTSTSISGKYDTSATQQDLMVCSVSVDTGADNFQGSPVPLEMKHALSSLKFVFRMEEAAKVSRILKSLSLDNTLAVSGTLAYQTGAVGINNWTVQQASGNLPTYVWSNSGLEFSARTSVAAYTTPEGTTTTAGNLFCNNGGHILIIPQTCSKAPCITIVTDTDKYENVSLGTTRFEPGKLYVYDIVIKDNSVNVSLNIKPWNLKGSSYDITF